MGQKTWYATFAKVTSRFAGRARVFVMAVGLIFLWLVSGPFYHFSDTWQLVINTSTTIVTFLMVFLIQNTQNRDTKAMQLKLDEVIRSTKGAHNALLDMEELDEDELEFFREKYHSLARAARANLEKGFHDTGTPEA